VCPHKAQFGPKRGDEKIPELCGPTRRECPLKVVVCAVLLSKRPGFELAVVVRAEARKGKGAVIEAVKNAGRGHAQPVCVISRREYVKRHTTQHTSDTGLLQATVARAQGAEKKKRRGVVVTDMAHA
tara:strand:- start:404 stop:784 length:381 start_codon:yes stop_codon:yes gene_type:complete